MRRVCREKKYLLIKGRVVEQVEGCGCGGCRLADTAFSTEKQETKSGGQRAVGSRQQRRVSGFRFLPTAYCLLLSAYRRVSPPPPGSQNPPSSSPPASITIEDDSAVWTWCSKSNCLALIWRRRAKRSASRSLYSSSETSSSSRRICSSRSCSLMNWSSFNSLSAIF